MAENHYNYNENSEYGEPLKEGIVGLEDSITNLVRIFDTMSAMKEGDGSAAEHFTYMNSKYGFDSDADMKAFYDELNAVMGRVNSDASVSGTKAALSQFFARSR